jgi:hypothetical protein
MNLIQITKYKSDKSQLSPLTNHHHSQITKAMVGQSPTIAFVMERFM